MLHGGDEDPALFPCLLHGCRGAGVARGKCRVGSFGAGRRLDEPRKALPPVGERLDQHAPAAQLDSVDEHLAMQQRHPLGRNLDAVHLEERTVAGIEASDLQVFDQEAPRGHIRAEPADGDRPVDVVGERPLRLRAQARPEIDGGHRDEDAHDDRHHCNGHPHERPAHPRPQTSRPTPPQGAQPQPSQMARPYGEERVGGRARVTGLPWAHPTREDGGRPGHDRLHRGRGVDPLRCGPLRQRLLRGRRGEENATGTRQLV